MAGRATFTFRLTAEGVDKLVKDLEAIGPVGEKIANQLKQSMGRIGPTFDQVAAASKKAGAQLAADARNASLWGQAAAGAADEAKAALTAAAGPLGRFGGLLAGIGTVGLGSAAAIGVVATAIGRAWDNLDKAAERAVAVRRAVADVATGWRAVHQGIAPSGQAIRAFIAEIGTLPGATAEAAQETAQAIARMRPIAAATFSEIGRFAGDWAKVLGTDGPKAAQALASSLAAPGASARKFQGDLGALTGEQVRHIESLERQGRVSEAQAELLTILRERYAGLAREGVGGLTAAEAKHIASLETQGRHLEANQARIDAEAAALRRLKTEAGDVPGKLDSVGAAWDRAMAALANTAPIKAAAEGLRELARLQLDALDKALRGDLSPKDTHGFLAGAGPILYGRMTATPTDQQQAARLGADLGKAEGDLASARALVGVPRRTIADLEAKVATLRKQVGEVQARIGAGATAGGYDQPDIRNAIEASAGTNDFDPEKALGDARAKYSALVDQRKVLTDAAVQYTTALAATDQQEKLGTITATVAAERRAVLQRAIDGNKVALENLLAPHERAIEQARIEAQVLGAPIAQRDVLRARLQAEIAAREQGLSGLDREAFIRAQVAKAVTALTAAERDALTASKAATLSARQLAVAWVEGEEAAIAQAQANEIRGQVLAGTVRNEKVALQALKERQAAEAQADLGKSIGALRDRVEFAEKLATAEKEGAGAVAEATRVEEVRKAVEQARIKAKLTGSQEEIDKVEILAGLYDELSQRQAAADLSRRSAQSVRALEDQLEVAKAELSLVGATVEQRRIEIGLLRLRQQIVGEGFKGADIDAEFALRRGLVEDIERATAATQEAERQMSLFDDAAKDAARSVGRELVRGTEQWIEKLLGADKQANVLVSTMAKLAASVVDIYLVRPALGQALSTIGLDRVARDFGYQGPQGAAAGGGAGRPDGGFGDLFGGGNPISRILDIPLWGTAAGTAVLPVGVSAASGSAGAITGAGSVGAFTSEAALTGSGFATGSGAAAAPFTVGSALPFVGAGLSIANAASNPNAFNIAGAAASSFGAIAGLIPALSAFGPWGLAAGAVLSLVGSFIKKKPSNEAAELGFALDDEFSQEFLSTKHPKSIGRVTAAGGELQELLARASRRYDVEFGPGASAGAFFGKKEGNQVYFDAGDRDGGIENRIVRTYSSPEEAAAAFEAVAVAAVKDGFRAAGEAPETTQAGRDLGIAMANSAAETFADLDADKLFGEKLESLVQLGAGRLDPAALARKKVIDEADALIAGITTNLDSFKAKASELGLGLETLGDGTTRLDAASRGFLVSLLGIEGEMTDLERATLKADTAAAGLTSILEAEKYAADDVKFITEALWESMVAGARAAEQAAKDAEAAQLRAAAVARLDARTSIERAIDPDFLASPAALFGAQGIDPKLYPTLFAAVNGAIGGDAQALRRVGERLEKNLDDRTLTEDQAAAIRQFAIEAFGRFGRLTAAGVGAGTPGAIGTSPEDIREATIRALEEREDRERAVADVLRDRVDQERRAAEAMRGVAETMRQTRAGLLFGPSSPLGLEQQLKLALANVTDARERIAKGGDGAPQAARDLSEAVNRAAEIGRLIFGSTLASSAQFDGIFGELLGALDASEGIATTLEQQHLESARGAEQLLADSNVKLEEIRLAILAARDTGGGGSGAEPPGAGFYRDEAGQLQKITFGAANLGRGTNESAADFLGRMFPQVAQQLAPGGIQESEGFAWAQGQHASGLGITNAAYFTAAREAGYPGAFGQGLHSAWLSADASGQRWRSFIDELRTRTHVEPGFFGFPYAAGGMVPHVPGLTTPGRDSFPAMLMPDELVVPPRETSILRDLVAANQGLPDNVVEFRRMREEKQHSDRVRDAYLGEMAGRLGELVAIGRETLAEIRSGGLNRIAVGGGGR